MNIKPGAGSMTGDSKVTGSASDTGAVAGLVVGGASGVFFGFGSVFWLFDPKAFQLPGLADVAFLLVGLIAGSILAVLGAYVGRWIGTRLARRRSRPTMAGMRSP
jgi:hypothetical protein